MFKNSRNIIIHDGMFVSTGQGLSGHWHGWMNILQEHIASGAFHNSAERYDPPKCHPQTRVAVLAAIMEWVKDDGQETFIKWLYGPLGSGKSAIAQTVAETCYELEILAASFFWCRSATGRNNEERLITSLAYQLIIAIPDLRIHVQRTLQSDHSLFSRSLEAQMDALILEPMKKAVLAGGHRLADSEKPRLIILDGLDECGTPKAQQYVLRIISNFIQKSPIPFKFLITSRSEQELRELFNAKPLFCLTSRLALDDTQRPEYDIKLFLTDSFGYLKESHPLRSILPPVWPTADQLDQLVQKSSGQFIYAATVVEFISSPRRNPDQQLQIIFGIRDSGNQTPFADLDALYKRIFDSVDDLPRALEIMGCLFAMADCFESSERAITYILGYERGDVHLILTDLHALLDVPEVIDEERSINTLHSSLYDFLTDQKRSKDLHVDASKSHAQIATWIMESGCWRKLPTSLGVVVLRNHCLKSFPTTRLIEITLKFSFEELTFDSVYDPARSLWESRAAMLDISAWLQKMLINREDIRQFGDLDLAIDRINRHLRERVLAIEGGKNLLTALTHPDFMDCVDCSAMSQVLTYGEGADVDSSLAELISVILRTDGSDSIHQLQVFLRDQSRSSASECFVHGTMYSTLSLHLAKFVFENSEMEVASEDTPEMTRLVTNEKTMIWAIKSLPFYLSNADYDPVLIGYLLSHSLKAGISYPGIKMLQDAIDLYLKGNKLTDVQNRPFAIWGFIGSLFNR